MICWPLPLCAVCISGNSAFAMAYLRGRYNGGAFTKTVIDATMCAIIAQFIRDLLDFAGLSSTMITSVFIGYIGTDSIGSLNKRFAAKKAEQKTVEINNQRACPSICWRGRRELDNGRQKTRNHGYDVIAGELFTDYSDHPSQTCYAKPKNSNQQAPDATSFFPVGGMPTASSLAWKTSPKSQTLWYCSRLRSVALYLWLIVVISVAGNRPLQQYLGFTAGRWLWSVRA